MKTDIPSLLTSRNLDGLIVIGPGQHNPPMVYLTGGGHMISAALVWPRHGSPTLFCNTMERDEAAKTGLPIRLLDDYKYPDLLKECGGDHLRATVLRWTKMLADCGLTSGRVALYGLADAGASYAIFAGLQAALPGLDFVGEMNDSMLMQARATKELPEIERMKAMGRITAAVVGQVADWLTGHSVRAGVLQKPDGSPLTIGEVKGRINLWLAEKGAENPEGTIFAIGRDAGVPHSSGTAGDLLRLGQTIVFDIFPCEPGGGYYYDFTRTWCLGHATDEALALYEDVLAVYRQVVSELKSGEPFKSYQQRTCELFEARGHATIQTNPQTQNGFVHSLGHGLGLNVHERPMSGITATDADVLAPGAVFTIEPGLYYPERGLGVRLEDTYWARPDGAFEPMAEFPMDLVLPMKNR